jgi:ribose transport system substrate-binding protein
MNKTMKYLCHSALTGALFLLGCQEVVEDVAGIKPDDARQITITMIAKSNDNPVFLSARRGAESAAKELTEKYSQINVDIDWRTPSSDNPAEQVERINNAVSEGSSAILVSCSADSLLTNAINAAVDSGVPVMTFDSDAPDSRRFAHYGANDVALGRRVFTELMRLTDGQGPVAILGGNAGAPNLRRRIAGIDTAMAEYPQVEVVGIFYHAENPDSAAATMLAVNRLYPQLKGWAMIGGWPFFNDKLMEQLTPGAQKIVAIDALPMQLPYLEKGYVQLLLGQPTFRWGEVPVELIIKKLHLKEEVNPFNELKPIPVTIENLGGWSRQLRAWGYKDIPVAYLTM